MFGIGQLLGKIFGTDKAISSIVDNTSKALDALVYTDEEKAGDVAADRSEGRRMVIDWLRTTSGQNLARRLIALIVTGVWVVQYIAAMLLSVAAVWLPNPDKIQASAKIVGDYADQMNGAMMLILGFYFAAPHLGALVKGAISKFSNRPKQGA